MAPRSQAVTEVVVRCVARGAGGYLIQTKKSHAVSQTAIPEGARVVIRDGQAMRVSQ